MKTFLRKYISPWIPLYTIIPLIVAFMWNNIVYSGTKILFDHGYHYDFTTKFDRMVPLIPSFTYIYLICYLFWITNYILVARQEKAHFFQFITADMLSRLLCAIFFIILPTTNIRPEVLGDSFSHQLLLFVYATDTPTNLFPSIHCIASWFCYIGIRGNTKIPLWYRIFSMVFAILVFISTQVTKQHYFVDIIGAVIIAEGTFYFTKHTKLYIKIMNIFAKITDKIIEDYKQE